MGLSKYEKANLSIDYHSKRKLEAVRTLQRKENLSQKEKVKIDDELSFLKAIESLREGYELELKKALLKIPPQAVDLEEAILGAIMLEKSAMPAVIGFLIKDHFYKPAHQLIYERILYMHREKLDIDMRTVVFELRKAGHIEDVGGAYYISELTSKVSSAANIEYHARCLVEMAVKRQIITYAGDMMSIAYEDTTDVFELIDKCEAGLKEIIALNIKQ